MSPSKPSRWRIPDVRPVLYNALFLCFLGLLAWGLLTTPQWDWAHLVVCIVAAGFVALLGNMDRLESFKAGAHGIEAKTREVVRQAEMAVSDLQHMAERFGVVIFELIDGASRLGGGHTDVERERRKAELLEMLRAMGVSEDGLKAVSSSSRRWAIFDYVSAITRGLPANASLNAQWAELWKPWRETYDRPDPDKLEAMLEPYGPVADWQREVLKDYRHFWQTNEHRRLEIFQRHRARSESWPI